MTRDDNPEWIEADFARAKTGEDIPAHIRAQNPTATFCVGNLKKADWILLSAFPAAPTPA